MCKFFIVPTMPSQTLNTYKYPLTKAWHPGTNRDVNPILRGEHRCHCFTELLLSISIARLVDMHHFRNSFMRESLRPRDFITLDRPTPHILYYFYHILLSIPPVFGLRNQTP